MGFFQFIIELLRDPRTSIAQWIITLGPVWVYIPLFIIIFIETGLVVTPFLPGDSLLFCAGIFCADGGGLNLWAVLILMSIAAILGNTSNYWIGRKIGQVIIDSGKVKALTPERIAKTQGMLDKYGVLAVFLTRFFPIIRTFAPFLAGLGKMNFRTFTIFNILGGVCWVCLFTLLGYFFGGIPFVEEHFEMVIIGIVVISLVPTLVGVVKAKISSAKKKRAGDAAEPEGEERDEESGQANVREESSTTNESADVVREEESVDGSVTL